MTNLSIIFLVGIIAFIGIVLAFGLIMQHIIRPVHDKMWGHKKKKRTDLKTLFLDGMFLLIMALWIPFIVLLTLGSLYVAVTAVIEKNILNSIIGIALSVFFGAKIGYMLEHRIAAEKRWKRKRNKK